MQKKEYPCVSTSSILCVCMATHELQAWGAERKTRHSDTVQNAPK